MTNSIEQTADNLVRSGILLNVSHLVSDAMCEGFGDEDELAELNTGPVDYEEALTQNNIEDYEDEYGCECWLDVVNDVTMAGTAEEACDFFGIDAVGEYSREVFEHWAVAPMMADSLEAEGETVVRDWHGLTIWARTTTGQAIDQDGVMLRIAEKIQNI